MANNNSTTANTGYDGEYVDPETGQTVKVKAVFVASPQFTQEQLELATGATATRSRVEALALAGQHIDQYITIPTPYDDIIEKARRKDSELLGDADVTAKVTEALMKRELAAANIKIEVAAQYLAFITSNEEENN